MRRKRNTALLTDQVRTKLMGKCVTAVVTEAFINGLPFNKTEIVFESTNLANYASNVIDKMNPSILLDRAMESTKNNYKANLYVQNLKTAIESVVDSATTRIVHESLSSDNSPQEIVAHAKLNSDETEKFVKASKQSGTDAVAKLVKDKMIDMIKDEKSSYEAEQKLRSEVKDVIKQESEDLRNSMTDDMPEDNALESYMNLVLSPTDARSHISVFSKMQDVCMESILHSNEEYYGEIPYETMEKITLESTFPYFDLSNRSLMEELNTMIIVTESANEYCDEEEMKHKKKKIAKTAFICSICIMTLLETLKTMHLAKPELADVKNFVDDATTVKKIVKTSLHNVEDKVSNVVSDVKKSVALGSFNTLEIEQAKESLEKVKGILEKMPVVESEIPRKNRIINKINSALEAITTNDDNSSIPITGSFVNRLREENITNLDHSVKLISQKPIVRDIQISLRSDLKCDENSKVDVEIKGNDASGACVATYMCQIHALPEFGTTVAEVVRECANYCDLGPKAVKMYFTDSGYSVPLKG